MEIRPRLCEHNWLKDRNSKLSLKFGSLDIIFVVVVSVTRLGDLLQFGQLFKASGDNYSDQIAHIVDNFVEIFHLF